MNLRLRILFNEPLLENPVEKLPLAIFYRLGGFWPGQFRNCKASSIDS
jgi:hypothetical protein